MAELTPWGTDAKEFDRELFEALDDSIANLRQAADQRRVELLARQIHASLHGESKADGLLALTRVLGVFLASMSPQEQITGIAIITSLIVDEVARHDRR